MCLMDHMAHSLKVILYKHFKIILLLKQALRSGVEFPASSFMLVLQKFQIWRNLNLKSD
jgi:hypothetical protein